MVKIENNRTMQVPFNYIACMDIPEELVARIDYPGDCSKDIDRLLEVEEIQAELSKLKPDDLKRELQEYGAWPEEELNNHSDNLTRILWIACCNINESINYDCK